MNTRSVAKKALKDKITLTAYMMFQQNGYDKTTVEAISSALGMSARNYFRYFPTKEDVLLERTYDFKIRFLELFGERLKSEDIWEAMKNSIIESVLKLASPIDEEIQAFIRATPALFSRQLEIFESLVSEATTCYMSQYGDDLSLRTVNALIRSGFSCLQAMQSAQPYNMAEENFIDLMQEMKPALLAQA